MSQAHPGDYPHKGGTPDLPPRWHPSELRLDYSKLGFYRCEIGTCLIRLVQREMVYIWHTHVMLEDGYATVKICDLAENPKTSGR